MTMTLAQMILAPTFVLTCFGCGVLAAILPAALAMSLIERHRPSRPWRALVWAGVGLAFATPSAVALATVLSQ
jgi:hypothetical protein